MLGDGVCRSDASIGKLCWPFTTYVLDALLCNPSELARRHGRLLLRHEGSEVWHRALGKGG